MNGRLLVIVVLALVLSSVRAAFAGEGPVAEGPVAENRAPAVNDRWARRFVAGAELEVLPFSLHTGLFGVLEASATRWATVELGVGATAAGAPAGLAMVRLQVPLTRWSPGIEAGSLFGPVTWDPGNTTTGFVGGSSDDVRYFYREKIDLAVFSRVGASLTHRNEPGSIQFALHLGATTLLNRRSAHCITQSGTSFAGCSLSGIPTTLPYFAISLGAPFDF